MKEFDLATFAAPLAVPRLHAPPVLLRPWELGDVPLVARASRDPLIPSIYSVHAVFSEEAGQRFVERQMARATHGDGFSFVVALEEDPGTGIGSIALWLNEIEGGRASIGYWLVATARGGGLAAHALRAVVTFGFAELAIPRLHLFVEPWNVASARTAEAVGFRREATLRHWERIDGEQRDADCFALLHAEWTDRPAP